MAPRLISSLAGSLRFERWGARAAQIAVSGNALPLSRRQMIWMTVQGSLRISLPSWLV